MPHDTVNPSVEPLKKQIGGDHYKKYKIQPLEFIYYNKIPALEAAIIKYVVRHKDKNGGEDLEKAKHLIDMLLELEYKDANRNI